MALYEGYERNKSGKGYKSYRDTSTGAIISYRQYRNIQGEKRTGFATISAARNAKRRTITVSNRMRLRTYWHSLGNPSDVWLAIETIATLYPDNWSVALVISYIDADDAEEIDEDDDGNISVSDKISYMETQPVRNTRTNRQELLKAMLAALLSRYRNVYIVGYALAFRGPSSED